MCNQLKYYGKTMKITRISLNKENRMLRIGIGKNEGRWFFRIDCWFAGFRVNLK